MSKGQNNFFFLIKWKTLPNLAVPKCQQYVKGKINNIAKKADSADNGTRKMEFSLLDDGNDGGYTGLGFVETSEVLVMQGAFFT